MDVDAVVGVVVGVGAEPKAAEVADAKAGDGVNSAIRCTGGLRCFNVLF